MRWIRMRISEYRRMSIPSDKRCQYVCVHSKLLMDLKVGLDNKPLTHSLSKLQSSAFALLRKTENTTTNFYICIFI